MRLTSKLKHILHFVWKDMRRTLTEMNRVRFKLHLMFYFEGNECPTFFVKIKDKFEHNVIFTQHGL